MANKNFLFRAVADTKNYDANLAKAKKQLDSFAKANLSAGGAVKQLTGSLVSAATRFASITAAVGALGTAFKSNIETAKNFEKSMSQLSSLTGMVGKDLEKLKGYAIELGASTTLTASQVADAFKLIGSQQPQLLQSGEALKQVTKYAITLSEAAGIELATAAQTLSTSINQMGGDSNNAARYVNVLAAASQKGAGDIAWLGEALTKSATAAKAVGTDYEELVANLEQLAKAGFDASTAGTALRSIIMNLEKQSNSEFKPSVVGLTQAFENLGKANLDLTAYQELVGKMFASQAKVLAEASGAARDMTAAITGTNIAEEQAKTNTDNLDGSLKQLSSAWEGLNLHINSSNGFLKSCVDWLKDVIVQVDVLLSKEARISSFFKKLNGGDSGDSGSLIGRYTQDLRNASPEDREALYQQQRNALQKMYADATSRMEDAQSPNTRFANFMKGGVRKWTKEIQDARAEVAAVERMMKDLRAAYESIGESGAAIANATTDLGETTDSGTGSGKGKTVSAITGFSGVRQIKDKRQFDFSAILENAQEAVDQAVAAGKLDVFGKMLEGQGLDKTVFSFIDNLKNNLSKAEVGSALYGSLSGRLADAEGFRNLIAEAITDGVDLAAVNLDGIKTKLFNAEDIDEELQALVDYINKEKGGIPIKMNFETGEIEGTGKKGYTIEAFEKDQQNTQKVVSGLQSVSSGLQQMGIRLPEGVQNVLNGIQGAMSVIQGVMSIIQVFQTTTVSSQIASQTANTAALTALTATVAANTAALSVNSATSLIPFAKGGVVRAANGVVPGQMWANDRVPALLNSGEVVLSRAQAGVLGSLLSEGRSKMEGGSQPYVSGEQVFLAVNNYLRRKGRGELITAR